jgi:hypothetical protein
MSKQEIGPVRATYRHLLPAWTVLQYLHGVDLNATTGSRVRSLAKALKPHIEARDETVNDTLEQCGALKLLGGKEWKRDAQGNIEFGTREGEARALAELEALADTEVVLHILPLEREWFDVQPPQRVQKPDGGVSYVPFGIKPAFLDALAEVGFLAGMEEFTQPDIEPPAEEDTEPVEATGT